MFYLTNTSASIVLSDTTLSFDDEACDLLRAAGNDANNWGQAGGNGATVSFTGRKQELAGAIVADEISTVTVNLLEGSTWKGAASVEENTAGTASEAPLTVNVDGASIWTVTGDCEISGLNVADGGQVLDSQGGEATIVAGGATKVAGDGRVTVTVTGSYGTSVEASDETKLADADAMIDRSAFDKRFGGSTGWTM